MAAPAYSFPQSAQLREIERDFIADLTMADPIFQIMPITESDSWFQLWDQQDNLIGLQQARGLDGRPARVKPLGAKQFSLEPGVYGEYIAVTEREKLTRRQFGTFAESLDISDLVMPKQQQLLARRVNRLSWLGWTTLTTGAYVVDTPTGVEVHADTFSFQTFTASILWSNLSSAIPIGNLRAVKLLARGHSVSFGRQAQLWMNQSTYNYMANNANTNDLAGRRANFGETFNDINKVNEILADNDLPMIRIHDDGYYDDTGTFQLWIPTGKAILVGKRKTGAKNGNLVLAKNGGNPNNAPGPYTYVHVDPEPPFEIRVHDGINPAPIIWYPSSIVQLTVA